MDLDGATILSAGGGMAGDAGFMISSSATTLLGFSLDGSTIDGCGTMVELELDGEATGLSEIIISDSGGILIPFEYYDCLLYTSPSPRDRTRSRMPSSA